MGLLLLWKGGAPQVELPSAIQETAISTLQGITLENRLPLEVYVSGVRLSG